MATAQAKPPHIVVSGTATVSTAPDIATIAFTVRGDGATAEAAVQTLVAARKRIEAGLAPFAVDASGAEMRMTSVRGDKCEDDGERQLSTGACAITGYIADLPLMLRTREVDKAATIVGQIGRLGGVSPRVEGFALASPGVARDRAVRGALADARARAQSIADGTGTKLGALVSATDEQSRAETMNIVVTGAHVPAPVVMPPIAVDAKPRPVETTATVTVEYLIAP